MYKPTKQLGIQILEYSLLGALIVGVGAIAVNSLQTGISNQLTKIADCIKTPSANCI
jgi:Flp pilus assembly pilin Flp